MELAKPLQLGAADRVHYSPDGKRLAVHSSQLSVWDVEKGTRLWRGSPVPYLIYSAFSPDSKRLAVKSTTGQIAVVDAATGKVLCDFRNKNDGEGCDLAFSPCGKFIVDGTWEGRLLVRSATNGKIECERKFRGEMINEAFAVDGGTSFLVLHNPTLGDDDDDSDVDNDEGDDDSEDARQPYFTRWKWPFRAKPISTVKLPDELYLTNAMSPDGKLFAFDSSRVPKKPTIDILSTSNGKLVAAIPRAREDRVKQLSWSADAKYLAVVKENAVAVYSADKFEPVAERPLDGARDVAFSPAGDTIALASKKSVVINWADLLSAASAQASTKQAKRSSKTVEPPTVLATKTIDTPEHQKSLKKILSALPAKSKLRKPLVDLASGDEDVRVAAYEQLSRFENYGSDEDVRAPSWRLTEKEAVAILSAGTIAEFPPPPPDANWKDGYHDALTLLWRSPYPKLLKLIPDAYEHQPRGMRRSALLALLGILGTREAAQTFVACIQKYGWPPTYSRVWDELQNLFAQGDVLLPDVALAAGKDDIGYLVDAITGALSEGTLNARQVAGRLDALAPTTVKSIQRLLKQLSKYQSRKGIAWRFDVRYSDARYSISSLLNLAGYLIEPKLPPLLREAAKFTDPVIAMSAAIAMLRQSGNVNKPAIRRAAQSHETRAILFENLTELERTDLFPKEFATWEAFAASSMVHWLTYPTELGREPDELRLEHTEWLDRRRNTAMFVWKFRSGKEPWTAGVSGPHDLRGKPRPTFGQHTFSRFDEWDSATATEHLERCVGSATQIVAAQDG